ncbi:MAG: hypothetical protein ACKVVP_11680, partial [Chloroflexota bacterium]
EVTPAILSFRVVLHDDERTMLINATHWSDMLTSPATLCALFLLGMFFVGELVTFFCTTVPKHASAWLQSSNLVIVGKLGHGWAQHRVVNLESADHAVSVEDVGAWLTVARAARPERLPHAAAEAGPSSDDLRAFARWLADRGRLDEWPGSDAEYRGTSH